MGSRIDIKRKYGPLARWFGKTCRGILLVGAMSALVWAGDGHGRRPHDHGSSTATHSFERTGKEPWRSDPRVRSALGATDAGCLTCHADIENAMQNMPLTMSCTFCHGGDGDATTKKDAHVQPTQPVIMDNTVAPLDYDLPYQQFVNPSNLRVVNNTCGICHQSAVQDVIKSMMATAAGHYAGGLYLNGVVDTKTPIYGTVAVADDDGYVPSEDGAVESLLDLVTYDPQADPSLFSTHFAAVPAQACARCHLWSRGKGFRGAVGADGTYRADGCAACHMLYADDGRSQSADASINHVEQGHPMTHVITKAVPTDQCLHCHHRGARIGLSFTGRAQMPPRLPSGPGVAGTTDVLFNSNYHYVDPQTNPPDVHHEAGLNCIDCHVRTEIMGDGNIYGHMDQATHIECRQCHGTPDAPPSMTDNLGQPLPNVAYNGRQVELTSKVTGQQHGVKQAMDIVNPASPLYNPRAACAMNDDHIKVNGGLECYACHSSWVPNCFGCHFERDEQQMGQNLVTRQWEVGKVRTSNKIFESLRHFAFSRNSEGRFAPYIVSCHPIAEVTGPDGEKILDFVMSTTSNGLSGVGFNPVNPHTVQGADNVRGCAECHRSPPSLGLGSGNYAVARDRGFTVADAGVHIFDRYEDPVDPPIIATLPVADPRAVASKPNIIEGTADYVYVAAAQQGLMVFDLQGRIPKTPVLTIESVNAIDVSRAARYLYVVDEGVGVRIYDNELPGSATLVATVPIPTAVRAVPWGIHLFVAAGPAGLLVVDISDHGSAVIVGAEPNMNAIDVTLYAHMQAGSAFAARAYVADPKFGVHVVDLLPDFDQPIRVSGLELPGATSLDTYTRYLEAEDVTPSREHDYLYVAAGAGGLHVFDITVPDDIFAVAAVTDLGGQAVHVSVSSELEPPGVSDHAWVSNTALGLQVIDVSDPLQPTLLSTQAAAGAARTFVEVQQMDRFMDEQGNELKENSHPFIDVMTRKDIVRLLSVPIDTCVDGACCLDGGGCLQMTATDCAATGGLFAGEETLCSGGVCDLICGDFSDCADRDGSGTRDDLCVWWACDSGECSGTAIDFAEMGGQFGACLPDGAVDGNDRFHALNCFSNRDSFGNTGYPCEQAPPAAYNVDAGGDFGSCLPDGVCDGHDAFHAINTFEGASTCSCGSDPAPIVPGEPAVSRESTGLTLRASAQRALAGAVVNIEVAVDDALQDLRGYQLHLAVDGGRRGALELIDIAVNRRPDEVFLGLSPWRAFNAATGQMVAGLTGAGQSVTPGAYLATYTYRLSDDAAGTFTVSVLRDAYDTSQRSYLFSTPTDGKIQISHVPAVTIDVIAKRDRSRRH